MCCLVVNRVATAFNWSVGEHEGKRGDEFGAREEQGGMVSFVSKEEGTDV